MFNRILNRLAGDYNARKLKALAPLVKTINDWYHEFDALSDDQIQAKTQEFKDRIVAGASLDDLLPEAFAVVKQASKRLIGTSMEVKGSQLVRDMIPYDSQLIGGIVLHQGNIAEMKTGEGKTLVASLPVYLNALSGKGVHVVSVNDYLSSRDAEWMGYLYQRLGLSVGVVTKATPLGQRRGEYTKDITYVENSELGFDYLRDNLTKTMDQRNMLRRPMNYAIVDEVDSILIDEARTPLIISEPNAEATDKYITYAKLVRGLQPCTGKKKVSKGFLKELLDDTNVKKVEEDGDYYIDEKTKTVSLSSQGIKKLEQLLGVENLYRDFGYEEIHHVENALRAQAVYHKDKDYIIAGSEVLIVDEHTGRTMPGRRYSDGLHQAIEAKEQVPIQKESKTLATITYQNFFKQYKKLAGMTGTATTEGEEFEKIYNLDVLAIPTNRNVIRVDSSDKVYFNQSIKRKFVMDYIKFYHEIGQPILIGTSSIHTSELVSSLLKKTNIQHYVLNAKFHEQEAHIVANAGKINSIVVATNMAGRGTDIKLDKGLNQQLASNYASRVSKQLIADDYLQRGVQGVTISLHSEIESDLTIDALVKQFGWDAATIRQSQKQAINFSLGDQQYQISLHFNKSYKHPTDRYSRISIKPITKESFETIEKTFHYGLFILGTEKHESRRIDNQLRGRAGRQGDPGYSCFFVALDDEIMRKMGGERIQSIASMLLSKEDLEQLELTQRQFSSSIVRAQKQMEARHFGIRKHLFDYDSVIDRQRQRIYTKRDQILHAGGDDIAALKDEMRGFIPLVVQDVLTTAQTVGMSIEDCFAQIREEFGVSLQSTESSRTKLTQMITTQFIERYDDIINQLTQSQIEQFLKQSYLSTIDRARVDHIDQMQHLRDKVGLYGYAQLDPLVIYKKEAFEHFEKLLQQLRNQTIQILLRTDISMFNQSVQQQQLTVASDAQIMAMLEQAQLNQSSSLQTSGYGPQSINTDGVEVIEVSATSSSHPRKYRPNDKISIIYPDGRTVSDVKYKKVQEDVESGRARIQ